MKRIFNFIAMLLLMAFVAKADPELAIYDFTIEPGQSKEIFIDMTCDEENIVTIGAIISLPEGLSFEKVYNRNRAYIDLTDRKDDHTVSSNILDDGSLKFLATSMSLSPFFDTSGPLFKITVKADENMVGGEYTYCLKKVEITTVSVEYTQELVEATVTVPQNDFTVSVSANDESYGSVDGSGLYEPGSEVTVSATAGDGYHFESWSNGVTENPYTFVVEGDTDLTAVFAPNLYTVSFVDGEATVSSSELPYGEVIIAPADPEKVGYTFAGWFNGDEAFVEGTTVPIDGVTYTAKYTVNCYTVTYIIDGEVISVVSVEYGAALPEPPVAPDKEGYLFKGWDEAPETMPAEDIIIVGHYEIVTAIGNIINDNDTVDIYTVDGRLVKAQTTLAAFKSQLSKGIYIINNKKCIIR